MQLEAICCYSFCPFTAIGHAKELLAAMFLTECQHLPVTEGGMFLTCKQEEVTLCEVLIVDSVITVDHHEYDVNVVVISHTMKSFVDILYGGFYQCNQSYSCWLKTYLFFMK